MNNLFYAFLYALSLLPLRVLYLVSDLIFPIFYYVIRYRKKLVYSNLKKSFPDKSNSEIKAIQKQYYHLLLDYGVETIKAFSITQNELAKRHTFSGINHLHQAKSQGKNVFLLNGHVFNWEWYIGLVEHLPSKNTYAVYHTIHNQFWNDKINQIRSRFGTVPLPMHKTARTIIKNSNDGDCTYLFVADQSPYKTDIHYELEFLNQPTPVFIGFDLLARKTNAAVIYSKTKRVKRGYYHTELIPIQPKNESFEPHEIVHQFFDLLALTIKESPANWLWSHRRWKYRMKQ